MQKPRFFTKLIPSITVTVLLLNLLAPVGLVFAQDGSPPADPPPAEEVVEEEEAEESPAEEEAAEEPNEPNDPESVVEEEEDGSGLAGTEEEETDEPNDPEAVVEEDTGTDVENDSSEEPGTTDTAPDEAAESEEAEENPVAEAVEALDEADAVLLDEEGEPLSMATQEAADTLAVPDPYFCPAGGGACTGAQATIAAAITDWQALGRPSGTFYIEGGFSFAGVTFTENIAGIDLVFQGGDGGGVTTINSAFAVNNSVFNSLTFNNITFDVGFSADTNTGDLSFNDVIANNAGGDGIFVDNHDGAVSLDNVTANGTGGDGASIDNTASSTDEGVTVSNSNFNNNILDDGLQILTDGTTTITNVNANGNLENGIEVDSSGAVTLNNVTANMNTDDGVDIENDYLGSTENVIITGLTAEQNAYDGLFVDTGGDATLTNINANNNDNDGIGVEADGIVTLNNVNANNNDDDGAELYNWYAADPAVNVFNSNFNGNGATAVDGFGLEISSYGTVTINNVSASNNTGSTLFNYGALIDNTGFGNDAAVNITNSVFNGNIGVEEGTGLEIYSDGQITLNDVQANDNQATDLTFGAAWGLYIENYGTGSGVSISNSSFNSNVGPNFSFGMVAISDGQITLNNVNVNQNGDASSNITFGAILDNNCGCGTQGITITDSSFSNNFADSLVWGLDITSSGAVTLNTVAANGNTSTSFLAVGASIDNVFGTDTDAPVSVFNSSFNNNVGLTDGVGLVVTSQGTIHLWGVSANGNSMDGVDLLVDPSYGPASVQIYCSFMQNNGDTGIIVDADGGDLKIASTDTSGNGVTPLAINNVANTIFTQTNCDPGSGDDDRDDGKHAPLDPKDPTTIVLDLYPHSVTFPAMNLLECTGYVKSLFYASDLPAELYAGDDFLRAMKIRIEGCDIPDGGMFTIGFDIPADEQGNEFAILFWDSSSWVEVPGQLSADGRYTGTWPETGYFVLVTR